MLSDLLPQSHHTGTHPANWHRHTHVDAMLAVSLCFSEDTEGHWKFVIDQYRIPNTEDVTFIYQKNLSFQ
jgi:hypothetical protein